MFRGMRLYTQRDVVCNGYGETADERFMTEEYRSGTVRYMEKTRENRLKSAVPYASHARCNAVLPTKLSTSRTVTRRVPRNQRLGEMC